jgi:hypothetical protein
LHRLALALGKTVQEIRTTMSAEELSDWMVFASHEPIGGIRDDFNAAQIAASVYNASGNFKQARKVTDFMPFLKAHDPIKDAAVARRGGKFKQNKVATDLFIAFNKATARLRVHAVKAQRPTDGGLPRNPRS